MKKNLFEQDIETKMLEITMQVLLKKLYVISSQQLKKISTFKHSRNRCDYWMLQISNYCQIDYKDLLKSCLSMTISYKMKPFLAENILFIGVVCDVYLKMYSFICCQLQLEKLTNIIVSLAQRHILLRFKFYNSNSNSMFRLFLHAQMFVFVLFHFKVVFT